MTAPTLLRLPAMTRRINDRIWESLDHGGHAEPIAFFCECGQEGCYLPVWLTPDEYEQGRSRPDWQAVAAEHPQAAAR